MAQASLLPFAIYSIIPYDVGKVTHLIVMWCTLEFSDTKS